MKSGYSFCLFSEPKYQVIELMGQLIVPLGALRLYILKRYETLSLSSDTETDVKDWSSFLKHQ